MRAARRAQAQQRQHGEWTIHEASQRATTRRKPAGRRRFITVNDKMQKGYRYELTAPAGRNFDPEFKPELTPAQMLRLGVFGGKYMTDTRREFPAAGSSGRSLPPADATARSISSMSMRASRSRCGATRAGSIPDDPRGWFQWYCRYYLGRRCRRGQAADRPLEGDPPACAADPAQLRAGRSSLPPAPTPGAAALGLRQPQDLRYRRLWREPRHPIRMIFFVVVPANAGTKEGEVIIKTSYEASLYQFASIPPPALAAPAPRASSRGHRSAGQPRSGPCRLLASEQRPDRLLEIRFVAGHRRHELIGRLLGRANAIATRCARRASSTSLRSATEAPPGWRLSHSQCRGSSVTSRATTPSFGRPGPRGVSGWRLRFVEPGPAASSQPPADVLGAAAKIHLDLLAGAIVEDQDRQALWSRSRLPSPSPPRPPVHPTRCGAGRQKRCRRIGMARSWLTPALGLRDL